jgi:hypothetical protein
MYEPLSEQRSGERKPVRMFQPMFEPSGARVRIVLMPFLPGPSSRGAGIRLLYAWPCSGGRTFCTPPWIVHCGPK